MKPLFIPLKRQFFEAFWSGAKDTEFRRAGGPWNARTCFAGRAVVLALGYGKHRMQGEVVRFYEEHQDTAAFRECYGVGALAACIQIKVRRCSTCRRTPARPGQRTCLECHGQNARDLRRRKLTFAQWRALPTALAATYLARQLDWKGEEAGLLQLMEPHWATRVCTH